MKAVQPAKEADPADAGNDDFFKLSSYLENIIELAFVGDLLRLLWVQGIRDVEVLRANVDAWGYDLVLARGRELRHIQLKSSKRNSATRHVPVNGKLQDKTGGCVVWIQYDPETLKLGPFLWFDTALGDPAHDIRKLKSAKRSTANASGKKPVRLNTYVLPKSQCCCLADMAVLAEKLIGVSAPSQHPAPD